MTIGGFNMYALERKIEISKIYNSDFDEVVEVARDVYSKLLGDWGYDSIKKHIDTRYSVVARDGDRIIGGYILNEEPSIDEHEDRFKNKKGIHGYAIFLKEEYRNIGIGDQLRRVPESLDFDYIHGLAFKSLNNANHWRKFGRYVEETPFVNISYKFLRVDRPSSEILSYFKFQDKSYNCGSTALEAILNFLQGGMYYNRNEIEKIAGTNSKTGTTHSGVEKVIQWSESRAFRNIFKDKDAFSYLDGLLSGFNLFLLRGLSSGNIKHWYVVYSKNQDGSYNLIDPARGVTKLTKDELESIWKPRDYDGFGFYR